ncbi:DMT family transporter [Dyella soli]|uniref:DMT family transporter n=1 Tax=Dyella soli TaxID=522319 RepID=A0A4R0YTF7_9GAMM|nr:DMT family transporter [Dyella soli]
MRRPLDTNAVLIMTVLCAVWGFQQVAIKAIAADVAPVMQIAVRSGIAAILVLAADRLFGSARWLRGAGVAGLVTGVLFAAEFLFVAEGLTRTTAAHMAVFLYTAPLFAALGLHAFAPGERLSPLQWGGVVIAFAGITATFLLHGGTSDSHHTDNSLLGDLMGICGGAAWGFTTVVVRTSALSQAPAAQTLFYQLAAAFIVLLVVALASGQTSLTWTTPVWMSLGFQAIIVSFASYLTWFVLLRRYLAARLGVLSFLTPLFGVAFGHVLLNEPVDVSFAAGAILVLGGAFIVNGESLLQSLFRKVEGA